MTTSTIGQKIAAARPLAEPGRPQIFDVRLGGERRPGSVLLAAAAVLLLGLAAAQGYVSWRAQFAFVYAAKHAALPASLEAVGLDAGAVIFALLGLAHARMGRPARVERALNLACAAGSMTMNLLGADLGSPRSVAVFVLPPLLYAAGSDRLIAVAGSAAGVRESSVWRTAGLALLYALRMVLAPPSTASGLRRWLLAAAPLPAGPPLVADTKKARLIAAYDALAGRDDRHGHREFTAQLAAELAPAVDLHPGTARTYLAAHLAQLEAAA